MEVLSLTKASRELFLAYAEDAGNWNGTPLLGGNVPHTPADDGNLTDLKKKGLLTTEESDGELWVVFTELGKNYARVLGVEID